MGMSYARNPRNAKIALEFFLGRLQKDIADECGLSHSTVYAVCQEYNADRHDMLKLYFTNDNDAEVVGREYGKRKAKPTPAEEAVDAEEDVSTLRQQLAAFERRVGMLENNMKALLSAATVRDEEGNDGGGGTESDERPLQAATAAAMLTLGQGTKAATATAEPPASAPTPPRRMDDWRANIRVHVTGQASAQWISLFGSDAHGAAADEKDIRRRIIGIFHNGTLTGAGSVYCVTGVNRYSMDGVKLSVVIQKDVAYVSKVERVPLDEI